MLIKYYRISKKRTGKGEKEGTERMLRQARLDARLTPSASLAFAGGQPEAYDDRRAAGTLHHMIVSGIEKRRIEDLGILVAVGGCQLGVFS